MLTDTQLDEIVGITGAGKAPVGNPIPDVCTAAELCALTGVSDNAGRDLATRGIWTKTAANRFDVRESIRNHIGELTRVAKRGNAGSELDREKLRVQRETADKLATQNPIARRDLIPVADVKAEWESILTDLRSALLAIPSRIPRLDRDAAEAVDREIREALERLADG